MKLLHKIVTLALASLITSGNIHASPLWWQKGVNFLKEHPYLTAGAAIGIGAGIYGYKLFCKSKIDAMAREAAEKIAAERALEQFQKQQKAKEATQRLQSCLNSEGALRMTPYTLEGFLEEGAEPNTIGKNGCILTILAQKVKDRLFVHNALENLMRRNPDLNIIDNTGMTALLHAADRGNWDVVLFLLKHHADPNICQFNDGITPLMLAINRVDRYSHYIKWYIGVTLDQVVEALLLSGANPNIRLNCDGNTALLLAVDHDSDDSAVKLALCKTVALLIKHGADIGIKNNNGLRALDIARAKNKHEIVDLLTLAYKNFKAIENDSHLYVSILPREIKDMTSSYICPK